MPKTKPCISIGIIALNEEENIRNMLQSVLQQKEDTYQIEKIIIISDGSTDNTVEEIKKMQDTRIELHAFEERIGKSSHLNTIFDKSDSDIVVLFDADIILKDEDTVAQLIKPLIESEVMFVGGNPIPTTGKTFIEKAVNVSCLPYIKIREVHHNGNTPYGCDGRVLALKKTFYKQVHVPADMIANDNYMYFSCKKLGYGYKYVKEAIVYYRSPTNFRDQIRQNKRFIAARQRLTRIFGEEAKEAYKIPSSLKFKYLFLQLIKTPILSLSIFFINVYCSIRALFEEKFLHAKWEIAETTKSQIETE